MRKLIIIMLFFSLGLSAQESKIRGQVVYGDGSKTLAYAKIELIHFVNMDNWSIVDSTKTDYDGFYFLKATINSNDKYLIRINKKANFEVKILPKDSSKYSDLPKLLYKVD
jgi:hypothetical protein